MKLKLDGHQFQEQVNVVRYQVLPESHQYFVI